MLDPITKAKLGPGDGEYLALIQTIFGENSAQSRLSRDC